MGVKRYAVPVELTDWKTQDNTGAVQFSWDYDSGREKLLSLYEKGKRRQWDAKVRIDWERDVDLDNPLGNEDYYVPIYGSQVWERMDARARGELKLHLASWQFSQFLHGEQGALICASKIVQNVPDMDSKFYAATQVMDEARHVEVYSTFLNKLELAYPINPNLRSILDQVLSDSRWDMTYLGMQVLIEGLALAAFGMIRNLTGNQLARDLTAYVMQDEARHVAFGRNALSDYYPQLSEAERNEREEFCAEACNLMRSRFLAHEVWENLGLGTDECLEWVERSEAQQAFRSLLFTRIVPVLRDIGLFGETMRSAFEKMGVLGFADTDLDALMADDERVATEIDQARRAEVASSIHAGMDDQEPLS
ncbi:MAG: ferritin-like domain-containing protein [Actinomycetota bacterium]|nr:ferritin-like domain-containing protein [Actinomycetota bacterium]